MHRRISIVLVGLLLVLTASAPVSAMDEPGASRVSFGRVQAHFNSAENGIGGFLEYSIRPFPGTPYDGSRHCTEDWKLLALAILGAFPEDEEPVTRDDAIWYLDNTSVDLILNGTPLTDTDLSQTKRLPAGALAVDFDGSLITLGKGWWHQTGWFMAPGALAVGSHTFSAVIQDPWGSYPVGPITFHIDPAQSDTCS